MFKLLIFIAVFSSFVLSGCAAELPVNTGLSSNAELPAAAPTAAAELTPTRSARPNASPIPAIPSPPSDAKHEKDEAAPINKEYLDLFTIDEGYCITDCLEVAGDELEYVAYELRTFEDARKDTIDTDLYWVVVVLNNGEVFDILRQDATEFAGPLPELSKLVLEADADFDGRNDVLIWLGHFGTQGFIRYACYLQRGEQLTECPTFSDIPNPALDAQNKVVLGCWRENALTHCYARYYFVDDEYVETERLTETPADSETEEIIWAWIDEVFIDGEWQVREYFTENDYDEDTLYTEKVYGEAAYWDISSDRWRTLFNNGKQSDFSIYESGWVEDE